MAKIEMTFYSDILGVNTSICAIIPSLNFSDIMTGKDMLNYEEVKEYPVLWLLHGSAGDHTDWLRYTCVERIAEENKIALITPSVRLSNYTDMAYGPAYFTYVTEELPKIVQALFPVSKRREDNYIAGLSMGGYGAIKIALSKPENYYAAASLSGGLDRAGMAENIMKIKAEGLQGYKIQIAVFGDDLTKVRNSKHDLFWLAEHVRKEGKFMPELYLCCGTDDKLAYPVHKRFCNHIINLGYSVTCEEGPGGHEWAFWDEYIEKVIIWLLSKR